MQAEKFWEAVMNDNLQPHLIIFTGQVYHVPDSRCLVNSIFFNSNYRKLEFRRVSVHLESLIAMD